MSGELLALDIRFEEDLVAVRQRSRQVAHLLGFDAMDQARISTAVSEITRNALVHGRGGRVEFVLENCPAPPGLVLMIAVTDCGSGIENLKSILDGDTAAGMGIAAARRLVDLFEADSSPEGGTVVVLGKRLSRKQEISIADAKRLARELTNGPPSDPYEEIRRQNQELVHAMQELRSRQEELERLNRELEDTNRGVVALYAELDDRAAHLRRSYELKTRFLSEMSHEFRTPLNAIVALSRLLLDRTDGPLTPAQARQVVFIQNSAQDLYDLVNDLLDLAKLEAGRIDVKPAPITVAGLFGSLRGMFRPLLESNAVSLIFEEPAPMPALFTDETKLSQILRNFISNALKFTERGEVRVSASLAEDGTEATFSVADSGIGIAPEDHTRIFEEFAQVDHPIQRKVHGTGLGLPLAKRLAELLGGTISLESQLGRGSTFRVAVPVLYSGPAVASPARAGSALDAARFPVVVLAEAQSTISRYEKQLSLSSFQPLAADSFKDACEIVRQIHPFAVILDVDASASENWDMLIELKRGEQTRGIPALVAAPVEQTQKALALGADEVCPKPVERSRLVAALEKLAQPVEESSVLIIDDEEVSRYVIRNLLGGTRYHILEAANGPEGIQLAREHRPGAILLDLVMPGMNGFEVLERLAEDDATRGIPVIIVTSKTLEESELEILSGRAVAILSKRSLSRGHARTALRAALARAEATSRRAAAEQKEPHAI